MALTCLLRRNQVLETSLLRIVFSRRNTIKSYFYSQDTVTVFAHRGRKFREEGHEDVFTTRRGDVTQLEE